MSEKVEYDSVQYVKVGDEYFIHLGDLLGWLKNYPQRTWERLQLELGIWFIEAVHKKKKK